MTDENFRPKEIYGLEDEVKIQTESLVSRISQEFHGWVDQIDLKGVQPKITFDSNDQFLNFNYTSTLQEVYKISDERILHIHGKSDGGELIFGHGEDISEPPELDEEGDSTRTIFSDAEENSRYPLYALKKTSSRDNRSKTGVF